jgi:hypothetical protein
MAKKDLIPLVGDKVLGQSVKELACVLSPEQYAATAARLGKLHAELEEHDRNEKTMKSAFKAKREAIETEIVKLAGNIRTKSELRPIRVQTEAIFAQGQAVDVRTDTLEPVETRALTADERQERLFAVPPPAEEAAAAPGGGDEPLEPTPSKKRYRQDA